MLFLCSLAEVSLCSGGAYGTVGVDTASGAFGANYRQRQHVAVQFSCYASDANSGADCGNAVGTADRKRY